MIGASTASARRRTPDLERRAGPRGPSGVSAAHRVVPRSASTISPSASLPPAGRRAAYRAIPPPEEEPGDDVAVPAARCHRHDAAVREPEDPGHHPLVPDGVEDGPPGTLDRLAVLAPDEADPERGPPEGDEEEEREAEEEAAHLAILADETLRGALPVSSAAVRLVAEKLCRSFGPRRVFGPLSFATTPGKGPRRGRGERLGQDDARQDARRPDPPLLRDASGSRTTRGAGREDRRPRRARLDRLVRPRPRPLRRADAGREPRVLRPGRRTARSRARRPTAGSPRSASTRSGSGRSGPASSRPARGSASSSPTRSSARPRSSSSTSRARTWTRPVTGRSRRSSPAQRARGSVVLATNDPRELALADERVTL